jgi:hypothetical protein
VDQFLKPSSGSQVLVDQALIKKSLVDQKPVDKEGKTNNPLGISFIELTHLVTR